MKKHDFLPDFKRERFRQPRAEAMLALTMPRREKGALKRNVLIQPNEPSKTCFQTAVARKRCLEKEQIYTAVIWGLVIVLTLIPFFRVGFTTGDDLEYYLTRLQGPRYWLKDAAAYAQGQGRFFFYLTKPFGNIPYLIDNFYYTKIVQYFFLLASYGFFAYFVFKIFKSRHLSLMVMLMLVVWTQVTFNHHIPTIAYPFSFSFVFILCISAFLLFIRYTETNRYRYVVWSAVLFFISLLFYENNLLFLGVFGLYILIRNIQKYSLKNVFKTRLFYQEILPFLIGGLLFIIIYFAYQLRYGTIYNGNAIATDFSFSHFCQILWHCTTIVLPGMNFLMEQSTLAFNNQLDHNPGLFFALTHAPLRVYVWAVLTCLLFVRYLRPDRPLTRRKWMGGILIAVFLSFFGHTLIGMTEKYNAGWYVWMRGYTTSFYALFGITLALALSLYGLSLWGLTRTWLYRGLAIGATGLMFVTLVLTGFANEGISREWQRSQNRFTVLDELAKSDYFKNIPEGSILYSPDLQYSANWGRQITQNDWILKKYIQLRSGRSYFYETTPENLYATAEAQPEALVFSLNTGETVKACEMMLAVSAVGTARELQGQPVESWRAKTADIFYYAPTKDYVLFYTCDKEGAVVRDGYDTLATAAGLNRLRCAAPIRRRHLTQVSLSAETPVLIPNGFSISNMLQETY